MSTFSADSGTNTYTIIPGTLQKSPSHDDRGGGTLPDVRAGIDASGSCECLIQTGGLTAAAALALQSGTGAGDKTIQIDGSDVAKLALLDVSITGDAVQVARFEWQGTMYT